MKELLLELAKYPYISSNKEVLTRLLTRVTDWDTFVKLVNDHGMIALSAYNITEARLGSLLPAKAMAILENGLMQSMVRNAWLADRWKEVNEILNEAEIKHILLKGMALEHTIYGARGLRQMSDTDILIKRDEAMTAWMLLKSRGFVSKPLKSSLHEKILPDLGKHLPELYKNNYSLEIHTRLFNENTPENNFYNDIFERSVEIKVDKIRAYILPSDINIRYLISHFNYHKMEGDCQVRLYADIKLVDPENLIEYHDSFINNPVQDQDPKSRKTSYYNSFQSIPDHYRLRFLIGDIFPSLNWMMNRYKCNAIKAMIRYPLRLGKILWLI